MSNLANMTLVLDDDEFDTAEAADAAEAKPMRPDRALVRALLSGRTAPIRKALRSDVAQVIQIIAPTPAWARAISKEIQRSHPEVKTLSLTETKKDRNDWVVPQVLSQLISGVHSVFCTTNAPEILPAEIEGTTDLRLDLPEIDAAVVKRAIRDFCGQRPVGLGDEDVEHLDFFDLVMAMRPGSSARDCVRRIKALAEKQRRARIVMHRTIGSRVEDLPLPMPVRSWAMTCLDELNLVAEGSLPASQLRFAVLEGAPGTGKTLLAEALARSAGWRTVSATMGDWFNRSDGHLGGVSKAIVRFFDTLLEDDKTIGFIDEIDGLPDRASLDARDRQWWTPVVNLFLKQIDRIRTSGRPIMLIGATNYYSRLDAAMVRPGRLEQRVHIPVPQTEDELRAIFAHYLAPDIPASELEPVARLALGATPALIEAWVKQARGLARHDQRVLTVEDVIDVIAPPDDRAPNEIRAVAIHEAGHAFVATRLGIGVRHVSIIARGASGGFTQTVPPGGILSRQHLEDHVTIMMAGRAADLILGDMGAHSGAAIDIEMATSLLTRGYCEWGLYESLGHLDPNSEAAFDFADRAIKRLLNRAIKLITQNRSQVLALATELQTRRFLKGHEIKPILDHHADDPAPTKTAERPSTRRGRKAEANAQVAPK
ncbi:AAA family ATPase [Devosia marina]|uniref:AAA family ATPase n=1 Tax=Devosia marina TaxID=2683198 RepID=A0A7X3FNN3_9HYPH|nr:AAA family ATPase [Devosia marina]MVS97908.1 AAA family ATPase [Devosia marina]